MNHLLVVVLLFVGGVSLSAQNAFARAESLAVAGDYQASNSILSTYITDHPARRHDIGRAWWLLSDNFLKTGRLADAREANETSAAIRRELRSGDLAENLLRTAEIELETGSATEALVAAQQALEMIVEDTDLYVQLYLVAAKAHAALAEYDWVENYLETTASILSIELPPDSATAIEAYHIATSLELMLGNQAAARHWYLKVVRYDKDIARVHELFEQVYPLQVR